jgi:uncharacterized membrane protein
MKKLSVGSLLLIFLAASALHLQAEDAGLFIIYAEGKGFEYVRNGQPEYVDLASNKAIGFELKAGDMVNIESKTSLELQLFPARTTLKVSESSSFTVKAVHATGGLDIDMAYGRLRTKTADLSATGNFHYNGVDIAAAGVGTDFGFDQIFTADSRELVPAVYCFGGALDVSDASGGPAGAVRAVSVAPQEMVTVSKNSAGAVELVKAGLGAEIKSLWQKNDFKTRTPVPPEPDETDLALAEPEPSPTPPPVEPAKTEPEADKETAPVAEPTTEKTTAPAPLIVDNKESALGSRDKLASVGEKDIFVNPDFNKEKEPAVATPVSEPPPAAEKEEEPAKETEAATETQPEPAPAPAPAPPVDPNAPPSVGFSMDMGVDIHYMPFFPSINDIPSAPGMEFISGLLNFLMRMKAGVIVDANLMFFGIIGIGVESGFYYNERTFVLPAFFMLHIFTIPIVGTIRLTLGPLFIQPHFGIAFTGILLMDVLVWSPTPVYMMGGKLGLRLGNMIIYATINLTALTADALFSPSSEITLGGGLLFKIF